MERKKISHSFTMRGSLRVPHSIPTSLFFKLFLDQKSQRTTGSSKHKTTSLKRHRSVEEGMACLDEWPEVGSLSMELFHQRCVLFLLLVERLWGCSETPSASVAQNCAEAAHDREILKLRMGKNRRCLSTEIGIHVRYRRFRLTAGSFVGEGKGGSISNEAREEDQKQQRLPAASTWRLRATVSACAMMDRKELGVSLCFVWTKKRWWGFDEQQPMIFLVTSKPMSLRMWLPLLSPGFRTGLMGNNSLLV